MFVREGWNTVMHDFAVEYPNCVQADDYLFSDCGSTSWAYFLFISFNIISMYIFVAIFVAVVSDNFSYVYQIASNFSLVNRDEIRKYPFFVHILISIHMNHVYSMITIRLQQSLTNHHLRSRKYGLT